MKAPRGLTRKPTVLQSTLNNVKTVRAFFPPATAAADCVLLLWGFALLHGFLRIGEVPVAWGGLLFAAAIFLSTRISYQLCFALIFAVGWSAWENTPFGQMLTLFALEFCLFHAFKGFRQRADELATAQSLIPAFLLSWLIMNRATLLQAPLSEAVVCGASLLLLVAFVLLRLAVQKRTPSLNSRGNDVRKRTIQAHARPQKEAFA